ncbi:neuraminidase-like domain-containing protein [Enterobacter sp. BIDMC 26]|uniref:Tc toxin subunit A-related protein n=1 Tax=Enterobacter sp. BIDMC 26 TaxID=1329838 RepID=UPI000446D73F|nr:neuraminidase-like domain-containing protein [Enterobacter sp. BIDMC 26]EUM24243.1 hypothetical protein L462_04328 [Enterobacter sp. BIDMC 26]
MSEHIQNMPLFAALAEKLNITTLSELGDFSLEQVLAAAGDDVGHADCHALHAEAVRRLALSTTRERQAVTRANPQLLQAPHLGISAPAQAVTYGNDFVPDRNDQFVKEGDVSSMFSPAAYLTEMYRNAEQLHEKGKAYHLDTRRPDLATLTLSQDNLDTPLSTLSLSNEILQATLKQQGQYDTYEKLHAALEQDNSNPGGPYHHAFTGISEALRAHEASPLTLLAPENRPAGHDDVAALCLELGISPALYAQLSVTITSGTAEMEYHRIFSNLTLQELMHANVLATRYGLPEAVFEELLGSSAEFSYEDALCLHRTIMVLQATGLPLSAVQYALKDALNAIDPATLSLLQHQREMLQRYMLPNSDFIVLMGGTIGTESHLGAPSQFDCMFNTPPLEGNEFNKLTPDQDISIFTIEHNKLFQRVTMRAFGVTRHELMTLVDIVQRSGKNALSAFTDLYRVKLLADIHGLTVTELDTILHLLGVSKPLTENDFSSVIDKVWTATRWLHAQKLSVASLQALLAETHSPVQTPEITALVTALHADVVLPVNANGNPVVLTSKNLIPALAPHFSTVLGLTSPEMTHLVMRWAEQNGSHVLIFWENVASLAIHGDTFVVPEKALNYCQKLGQMAAIVKGLDLSERELALVVENPKALHANADLSHVTHKFDSLMLLSRFHYWVSTLGVQASAALTALQKGTLAVKNLAEMMSLEGEALAVAAEQAGVTVISDFITVERLLQWYQASQTLSVSATAVSDLFAMRYVDTDKPVSTFRQWQILFDTLLTGLTARERQTISAELEERLSAALSHLYIGKVAPAELKLRTRDDLYGYLLIDSQVSADVTTTRIAEAMASLQLYVNRCMQLGHLETGVKTAALSRPFFRQWATYNRRYSTWAGVSQLAYYPENYVDPTQRAGESTMMRTLQQSLNQGQLTQDQVEGAFKHYLSEFEKVANLKIISGYHEYESQQTNNIWLIGATRDATPTYYWRKVDMSQFKEDKFPATAWTEWQEITVAAAAFKSLIRPVTRDGRLHLIWVEQRQNGQNDNKPVWVYSLKESYLGQNGAWSAEKSFSLDDNHFSESDISLLCSEAYIDQSFGIALTKKSSSNNFTSIENAWRLSPDGELHPEKNSNRFPETVLNDRQGMIIVPKLLVNKIALGHLSVGEEDYFSFLTAGNPVLTNGSIVFSITFQICTSDLSPDMKNIDWRLNGNAATRTTHKIAEEEINLQEKLITTKLTIPLSMLEDNEENHLELSVRDQVFGALYLLLYVETPENILRLHCTRDNAQYMSWGYNDVNVVRLNTLFGPELIKRGNRGLDSLLSLKTQLLPEPTIRPKGAQVTLTLDKYSSAVHGSDRTVTLRHTGIGNKIGPDLLFHGELSPDATTQVTVFMKYYDDASGNKNNFYIEPEYQKGKVNDILIHKAGGVADVWSLDKSHNGGTFPGLVRVDRVETFAGETQSEPMDFAGANALYFWELFYYAPMLIAQRLLQEQSFDDASRWLRYVFSPEGYGDDDGRHWNARPLLDDTRWNDTPLDSTDPDAVAQSDPMHYKVATLMRLLELLTARGDHAYRQLERDTLAEAKMWYVQALALMGDESVTRPAAWVAPTLKDAAGSVVNRLQAMEDRQASPVRILSAQPYTANALTGLFNPQQNARWQAIRQDLMQRLYNLRHNLTLDGQPLTLPMFATPADPAALLSAAAAAGRGGTPLPSGRELGLHRFPLALESARNMTGQLMQFGNALSGVIERQDAEAMAVLMQTQGKALMVQSVAMQKKTLEELGNEAKALAASLAGAQKRQDYYGRLYDENISAGEGFALGARVTAGAMQAASRPLMAAGAAANMVPNIFGLADGGSQWGSIPFSIGMTLESIAAGMMTAADGAAQGEMYRRRREEWEMLRDNAEKEVEQLTAQQASLAVRTEAAGLQLTYLETQQAHNEAQLALMQRKFSNQALYNWLRGRLSALYFQFYDLTVSRCLRAEKSFQWETGDTRSYIRPGAWQGTYAGLLCGEALMLNLAAMESAYQKWDARALEVERTLSLGERYGKLSTGEFSLKDAIETLLAGGKGKAGNGQDTVSLDKDILSVSVELNGLGLASDYPEGMALGKVRRIKQISVTLPALLGPYQDVQAVLGYTGTSPLARGCSAIAVSRGMNDSGQFQLDFNDGKYLPFEGIDISDTGTLTLRFPTASDAQKALLASLSDIILHVRYTIRD